MRLAYAPVVQKPRVMQLVLSLSPGGTERLVIEIVKSLSQRIDSVVCCLDEPGAWADELTARGVPVIALGRTAGFHPSLAFKLARLIREHQVQVVHCHHYSPYVYGLLASLVAPVQLVFTEHGRLSDAPPSRKRRLVNPVLARLRRARICAVSADLREHMIAEGFPAKQVGVTYNGIEPGRRPGAAERQAARSALGVPADAFVVGTVGRLDPVKNLGIVEQAHAELVARHPHIRTVIVGDGPERAALQARAQDLGISDSIIFAGYRQDVRFLMSAFDLYVNSSTYEGVSLTILEAMASALPVIATPAGGNPEVVMDQETGLLVPDRPRAFAEAISRLMHDDFRRHTMGEAGRFRVKRHFSISRMVEEYAALYFRTLPEAIAAAPANVPIAADTMSVSEATRSSV
jgi:glycosyltransferase involved in cell wall biosynthesis